MASVRGRRSPLHLWPPFAVGALLGGATTGIVLAVLSGLVSPLPTAWRVLVAAVGTVGLVVLDLLSPRLRLPQRTTLIPQEVFARGIARGIFRFGYEYGTGVRTLIPSAASYVVALALVLVNLPWWQTILVAASFGLARTLAVLQYLLVGDDGWGDFLSTHTRFLERAGSVVTGALVLVALHSLWVG
jgi:hypothetical protein